MTLRTVNPYTSYQTLLDLQRTKAQLTRLSGQLASGSRLTDLGEDPTASALVLDFQTSIDQNKASISQADTAQSFLGATETSLSSLNTELTRALELAEQGLSETTSSGRASIAEEIDGIRTGILSLANTQAEGKYLFAGTRTTTQPFTEGATGTITYAGDDQDIDLDITSSASVTTNLTGSAVFLGSGGQGSATDVFQQLSDLSAALTSGSTTQIQTAFDNLKALQAQVNVQISKIGGRESMLQDLQTDLSSYNTSLQTLQGSYQDLDYAAAVTEYTSAQTAQQASLSVLAKQGSTNLFDYLG